MSQEDLEQAIASLHRAVRLALYGCLFSVLAAIVIGVGTLAYAGHLDDRQRSEARQADRERAEQGEVTRQLICSLSTAQADAFRDATSEPGRKSRDAWLALAARFDCS